MSDALVDSCVLLDLFTRDPEWADWSRGAIMAQVDAGDLIINPVVYAEVSGRFGAIEDLEDALAIDGIRYEPIPRQAAFLAGKCYVAYRRRGGAKLRPLPDFFIGAHAAVARLPLITRDPRRFRTYFPRLELVCPD